MRFFSQLLGVGGRLERAERLRQRQLFAALNRTALAVLEELDPEAMVDAVSRELDVVGFKNTIYRLDGADLVLTHQTFSPDLQRRAEWLTGLRAANLRYPVHRVGLLHRAVTAREVGFGETQTVMMDVLGGGVLARPAARAVVAALRIRRLAVLPIVVDGVVERLLVVLSDELRADDLEPLRSFAGQLSAALRQARLRQRLHETIVDLQQARASLNRSQRLEAMGQLAGGVAHDLNNLLQPILATADMVLEDGLAESAREELELIRDAAERAARTTERVMVFARRRQPDRQLIDARDVLREAVRLAISSDAGRHSICSDIDREPLLVAGDRAQLMQVLLNVSLNGLRAMPHGGKLTLTAVGGNACHPERPGVERPVVRLRCVDEGEGMSAETQERLFEPFFTTRSGGTGLGLSVAHGIVAEHDGWFEVETQLGRGSDVSVLLPAVAGPQPSSDPPARGETRGRGKRALLVEDRLEVERVVTRMLERDGHSVTCVGALGAARAALADVDFVVCDVNLPDGEGWSLADCGLPVLFMTGQLSDAPPGCRVLRKPFGQSELRAALHTIMPEFES